ncbi:MAG: hypothetical protein M0Z97_10590 [Acidithiobacillus sp.]|nr:hypothetical protein [Acidithiobacillus sp.]
MTEKKNTGMSIMGLLQNVPSEASPCCIIDVGQSMRHSLLIGETRDAAIVKYLESALGTQECSTSMTFHHRSALEKTHA